MLSGPDCVLCVLSDKATADAHTTYHLSICNTNTKKSSPSLTVRKSVCFTVLTQNKRYLKRLKIKESVQNNLNIRKP